MAEPTVQSAQAIPAPIVTDEQRLKAEEFIALEEGAHHKFAGAWGTFLFAVAVVRVCITCMRVRNRHHDHAALCARGIPLFSCFFCFPRQALCATV